VVQAPLQLRVAAPAGQPGEALLGLGHVPAARAERAVERVVEHQQERQEAEQDRGRSPDADGRGGEQGGEEEAPGRTTRLTSSRAYRRPDRVA
jgi:hypothetical protein